ncbi:MAG: PAS domain S-box protein [Labrys sp. (in: a-proteobacteria)]
MKFPFSFKARESDAVLAALDRSLAIIEFTPEGTILTANANFLAAMGYQLSEIQGKHHSIFVEASYRDSAAYTEFWAKLRRGDYQAAQYKRLSKGGREVWIEASYNPVLGRDGKPFKIVKFATDITERTREFADLRGQVDAINKSSAVISFDLDGKVLDANANFLTTLGYSLGEIRGRHHSMFVGEEYARTSEYRAFWEALRRGEFQAGQYRRVGKGGKEVWIEASYNPILTPDGRPYKVVKFATDITKQIALMTSLQSLINQNFGEIENAVSRSNAEASSAAHAASDASGTVQTLASGAEELAASVAEIAESMSRSRIATDSAFKETEVADAATGRLVSAAKSMGGIVSLIQEIAGQINLLALNATIESARAGEAGRGFAVVASEVKNLANQAGKATEQISREIDGIQAISSEVVGALDSIRNAVDTVRGFVSATATAVEEQSAVTRSMSSSMHGAAEAVGSISRNVSDIGAAVTQIASSVATTKEAARVLAR